MHIHVTINKPDGTESEFETDIADFSEVRNALNDAMEAERLTPDDWSSLLVTIVPAPAPAA